MLNCRRRVPKGLSFDACIETFLHVNDDLVIKESSFMVDGIGGTTWDGSLLLIHFLLKYYAAMSSTVEETALPMEILEIGAGCGVVSLLAAKTGGFNVTCTDREIDLIEENMKRNNISTDIMNAYTLDWGDDVKRIPVRATAASPTSNTNGDEGRSSSDRNRFSVICGAEITVLNKQHDILIDTVEANADEDTLILFTFDELLESSQEIMYKKKFTEKMSRKGYKCKAVMDGEVIWLKSSNKDDSSTNEFNEFVASICINDEVKASSEKEIVHNDSLQLQRSSRHHLLAFFKNESSIAFSTLKCII